MIDRKRIVRQVFSRASSTVKSYISQYRKFVHFVQESKLTGKFPYTNLVISQYLLHLFETKKMYSVTLQAQRALKWVHDLVPLESNPADSPLVRNIVEASKRAHHAVSCEKQPISVDALAKIVAKYTTLDSDLKDLRTALLFTLGFFGLFRASELVSIKAKDITINTDHLIILVPKSKTDQYRNGNKVYIVQTNGPMCPHTLLLRYFSLANICTQSDE